MNRKTTNRKTARKAGAMSIEMILLLIVAIVGVGIAFLFFMGYIGTAAVNPKAAVQQFDITVTGGGAGKAVITLVIKNTGNVRITDIATTWVNAPDGAPTPTAEDKIIDPGKTKLLIAEGDGFVAGNQYSLRVTITYANGATEVLTATATAHP